MKYNLRLGGYKIPGVTAVSESIRREAKEYLSISGEPFCLDRGGGLKFWRVKLELCLYDGGEAERLLSRLRKMGQSGQPQLLSVSWDLGGFSSRVLIRELETEAISGEAGELTLGLLQYLRPQAGLLSSSRPGSIPEPPQTVTADEAYLIITKYQRAGEPLRVANPSTGVDIDNLAAIDGETPVSLSKAQ